eukprot:3455098-Prymnesium_polylepis.1
MDWDPVVGAPADLLAAIWSFVPPWARVVVLARVCKGWRSAAAGAHAFVVVLPGEVRLRMEELVVPPTPRLPASGDAHESWTSCTTMWLPERCPCQSRSWQPTNCPLANSKCS